MRNQAILTGVVGVVLAGSAVVLGEDLAVLPAQVDGVPTRDMMKRYLRVQVERAWEQWQKHYEARKTPEQIAAYQKGLRDRFVAAIGGLPERTPLNTQVTGVIRRNGYTVTKLLFESQPKLYVTALLFLPESDRFKPPYPGVLVPCGHSANGKAWEPYQTMGALLALNGMAALVFDPIDQGERYQLLDAQGKPRFGGTTGHSAVGVGSILVGRNTARFEIWDAMRALDVLASRPDVDPNRIGCTGNSGGGTQTSYMMALDDRIVAAAPSCYLTHFAALIRTIGAQDAEQNIHGQLAFGMDHPDYIMMRAPTPILICAATKDFFDIGGTWETFRYAKRLYSRMGFSERVDLLENDAPHNYDKLQREAVVRWLARWLLKRDEPITEPPIQVLSESEVRCTPQGQVVLLPGARTVYDLNEDYERELAAQRRRAWETPDRAKLIDEIRRIAGIRRVAELPRPKVEKVGELQRASGRIEKLVLVPEEGISLPALLFAPSAGGQKEPVLYLHEQGNTADAAPDGPIEQLVREGRTVLAPDLRGIGQTQPTPKKELGEAVGPDWQDAFAASLLGRSYVGMRAEDVLTCVRYLVEREPDRAKRGVVLVAVGHVGVPALHAAALESDLVCSVKLTRTLVSWSNVLRSRSLTNQLINAVYGALKVYDLPDLARLLGTRLTIEQPLDANGQPARSESFVPRGGAP